MHPYLTYTDPALAVGYFILAIAGTAIVILLAAYAAQEKWE